MPKINKCRSIHICDNHGKVEGCDFSDQDFGNRLEDDDVGSCLHHVAAPHIAVGSMLCNRDEAVANFLNGRFGCVIRSMRPYGQGLTPTKDGYWWYDSVSEDRSFVVEVWMNSASDGSNIVKFPDDSALYELESLDGHWGGWIGPFKFDEDVTEDDIEVRPQPRVPIHIAVTPESEEKNKIEAKSILEALQMFVEGLDKLSNETGFAISTSECGVSPMIAPIGFKGPGVYRYEIDSSTFEKQILKHVKFSPVLMGKGRK